MKNWYPPISYWNDIISWCIFIINGPWTMWNSSIWSLLFLVWTFKINQCHPHLRGIVVKLIRSYISHLLVLTHGRITSFSLSLHHSSFSLKFPFPLFSVSVCFFLLLFFTLSDWTTRNLHLSLPWLSLDFFISMYAFFFPAAYGPMIMLVTISFPWNC